MGLVLSGSQDAAAPADPMTQTYPAPYPPAPARLAPPFRPPGALQDYPPQPPAEHGLCLYPAGQPPPEHAAPPEPLGPALPPPPAPAEESPAAALSPDGQEAESEDGKSQPKRLHVSNIPFRFRDPDLRQMFGQFGKILDVEIIFNERGSKGFGFVTFDSSQDADQAREKLNSTVVEGRKIEVNNATARVVTKKPPAAPAVNGTRGRGREVGRSTPWLALSMPPTSTQWPPSPTRWWPRRRWPIVGACGAVAEPFTALSGQLPPRRPSLPTGVWCTRMGYTAPTSMAMQRTGWHNPPGRPQRRTPTGTAGSTPRRILTTTPSLQPTASEPWPACTAEGTTASRRTEEPGAAKAGGHDGKGPGQWALRSRCG
ncbi:RNA binding protein fox-1 homolog 1 isoform X1 [Caretta caretta]|uniref:RNA binding protein fox-1 homolog 1 isoform X1 n=1 Tax=Caretta caretta TaxID=8467 RepID=UPI003F4C379B